MASVKFKVLNEKDFEKKLRGQSKDITQNIIRAVNSAATNTRNTAVVSILQNSRSGPQVTRYNPKRTIRVSAEGDPPASDSGFLANNISVKIDADGFGASVLSNADYSEFLEFGTIKMAARPFMQPALEENKKKFNDNVQKAIKKGLKR